MSLQLERDVGLESSSEILAVPLSSSTLTEVFVTDKIGTSLSEIITVTGISLMFEPKFAFETREKVTVKVSSLQKFHPW